MYPAVASTYNAPILDIGAYTNFSESLSDRYFFSPTSTGSSTSSILSM